MVTTYSVERDRKKGFKKSAKFLKELKIKQRLHGLIIKNVVSNMQLVGIFGDC
jgi:hypothetical protein